MILHGTLNNNYIAQNFEYDLNCTVALIRIILDEAMKKNHVALDFE